MIAKVEGGIINLPQSSGDEAMNTSPCVLSAGLYKGHRFPAEIISHCVWLYFRFCLSYRDVEEMMVERGIAVSYESVGEWCLKFGGAYAKPIRSRGARPGDRWYIDEGFLRINGKLQYLWRAVDQDGEVVDILVQPRRNKQAAKKFFRELVKAFQYVLWIIITDKLRSYSAAKAEVMPSLNINRMSGSDATYCT